MAKQEKGQTKVLLWNGIIAVFLFVSFKLRILENVGESEYIRVIVLICLLLQMANHIWSTWSLHKKQLNFTNQYYPENIRMLFGNMIASTLVLGFNVFNYEQYKLNYTFEVISIPFILMMIFFTENARGGLFSLERIYFPKKWDQFFKTYGVNIVTLAVMVMMWLPLFFQIPISALLWVLMSTLLLKQSIIYTNKYNHLAWCFLIEALLAMQLLTLGFQSRSLIFLGLGVIVGILFLMIYLHRMGYEKGLILFSIPMFLGAILYLFYSKENISVVFCIQAEVAIFTLIFFILKIFSWSYRKILKKSKLPKKAVVTRPRPIPELSGLSEKHSAKKKNTVSAKKVGDLHGQAKKEKAEKNHKLKNNQPEVKPKENKAKENKAKEKSLQEKKAKTLSQERKVNPQEQWEKKNKAKVSYVVKPKKKTYFPKRTTKKLVKKEKKS